jgi:hypothetical protein
MLGSVTTSVFRDTGGFPDAGPAADVPRSKSFSFTITDPGTITSFDSIVLKEIFHTWASDLTIELSNGSVTAILIDGDGGSADFNFLDYEFADGGTALPTTGIIPDTAVYGTANPLADFVGQPLAGTWTLTVTDSFSGDFGLFAGFDLNITAVVPEPTTLAALGGLGLVALRRRK